jgi:hypothetical protein
VETAECPHCGAPTRPTATFCLACDQPITDTERGLSVAEATAVPRRARPVLVGVVALLVLAVVGGSAYGVVHWISGREHHTQAQAASDARRAITLLVRAESGEAHACHRARPLLSGTEVQKSCTALVGHDPGVRLSDVRTTTRELDSTAGTVRLTATVTDSHGTRPLDEVLHVTEAGSSGQLQWDGSPPV